MKRYPIGVTLKCRRDTDLSTAVEQARALGLCSCQLVIWDPELFLDHTYAEYIKRNTVERNFPVTALWAGWSGPREWNFTAGPATVGLVPPAYRAQRLRELKAASDFAEWIGVEKMATHVGFIPEAPSDPCFNGTVEALRELCRYMKEKNQIFLFEAGQETPTTMLRTIQEIGLDNVGINFDTANLMLYGKADPLDALRVFGSYVKETHIKDGFYPTDRSQLGKQVPVGEGLANIPAILHALEQLGYAGSLTIEREITGEQQVKDIIAARDLLLRTMEQG